MDVRYTADTNIADSRREYEMAKAAFDQEVNRIVSVMYQYKYRKCNCLTA